ncbi:hypothetical protein KAR91_08995, partial [Candidatus Pacearchaeota archaeon]|nr:hypothetical protein [Candidatus Pacearchaeota archaeon]
LVTKNLTYSKRLIEKELGKASDMPSPPTELTYKKVNTVMSEVESIKLKKRQRKSMMQISIENYEYAFGEKHKQLIKSIKAIAGKKKKQVEAYIKIGGMHLCFILHIHKSHKDKLQFTVWRTNEDGTGIGDGWFSEISAAINTFPELIDAKWDTK